MFSCIETPILFAAGDRTERMMEAFRAVHGDYVLNQSWSGLFIGLASLSIAVLIVMVLKRYWRRWIASSPRSLFMELCRAQRLTWPQIRLLWRLAQSQNLKDPASLFLTPECFEIGRLTVEMRPHAEELQRLKALLFIETSEESKSEQSSGKSSPRNEEQAAAAFPRSQIPPTLDLPQWNANTDVGIVE
jgi:hypothetical protein